MIEPSRFDAGTAYVVVDAHRLDDMKPYLFKTTDYGRTWTRLDATLPTDVYLHVVREDPVRRGLLYLGTERGMMFSTDGGTSWKPLQLNLPTVAVHDLQVKDDAPGASARTAGRSGFSTTCRPCARRRRRSRRATSTCSREPGDRVALLVGPSRQVGRARTRRVARRSTTCSKTRSKARSRSRCSTRRVRWSGV